MKYTSCLASNAAWSLHRRDASLSTCTAAPYATASSGLIDLHNSLPLKKSINSCCTLGIRVDPPTKTTSCTWPLSILASRNTCKMKATLLVCSNAIEDNWHTMHYYRKCMNMKSKVVYLLHWIHALAEEVHVQLLETSTSDGRIEVDTLIQAVDLNGGLGSRGQSPTEEKKSDSDESFSRTSSKHIRHRTGLTSLPSHRLCANAEGHEGCQWYPSCSCVWTPAFTMTSESTTTYIHMIYDCKWQMQSTGLAGVLEYAPEHILEACVATSLRTTVAQGTVVYILQTSTYMLCRMWIFEFFVTHHLDKEGYQSIVKVLTTQVSITSSSLDLHLPSTLIT